MALGQNEPISLYVNGAQAPGLYVQDSQAICRVSEHPLLQKTKQKLLIERRF